MLKNKDLKPIQKPKSFVLSLREFEYHRNGISGQAFYYVYFINTLGGHLHAVIPVYELGEGARFEPDQVYVINPLCSSDCYCGDAIGDELIPLLKVAIAKRDLEKYGTVTQFAS